MIAGALLVLKCARNRSDLRLPSCFGRHLSASISERFRKDLRQAATVSDTITRSQGTRDDAAAQIEGLVLNMRRHAVTEIDVYAYYPGVSLDVAPLITQASGEYMSGQLLDCAYQQLTVSGPAGTGLLCLGGCYSWSGCPDGGRKMSFHWLYCTSVGACPTFGLISCSGSTPLMAPLLPDLKADLIRLEEITDIAAVFRPPHGCFGSAQAQLGKRGWLVQSAVSVPICMGVLIADQLVPQSLPVGAGNISISAKSQRTLQSIRLDGLCRVPSAEMALFLQPTGTMS